MKKFLVPTDFSPIAEFASDLAIELAPLFNAQVQWVHQTYIPKHWDEYTALEKNDFPETLKRLDTAKKAFARLSKKYSNRGVKIDHEIASKDLLPLIQQKVRTEGVNMVIMGSHGYSGYRTMAFGSNAQKVVRHVDCPVLVIKRPVDKVNFKNIVFASDFSPAAKAAFDEILLFARRFNAHLHLLYIAAYPKFEPTDADIARMKSFVEDCPLSYTLHGVGDLRVESGIRFFVEKINADLLTLAHQKKSSFQRILSGSITEALVNELEIPVLALNQAAVAERV